jgi:hypothetical protein
LIRATDIPASIIARIIPSSSDAGPKVQTILVRGMVTPFSVIEAIIPNLAESTKLLTW